MIDHLSRLTDIYRLFRRPRFSSRTVERYRENKLRRVVEHAYRTVPYYRALFGRAGITPADIRDGADLQKIPITTKRDLKEADPGHYLSTTFRASKLGTFKTTGSTGIPLVMRRSSAENFMIHLIRMRAVRECGLRCRDRVARIRSGGLEGDPAVWKFVQKLGFWRQSVVNAMDSPQKMARDLLALEPDVVTGYNGALARVGQIIVADLGRTLPVRFVVGGADMITPLVLKHIETAFQAPVHDHYGCQEFGLIASQCRASGLYHICDDSVILEVLKDGRPAREGERGEAVVTGLHLRAMPFIRYSLEDLVTIGPATCSCGRNYPTLKSIEAKKQDYFKLPGGREFYPWSICLVLLEAAPWIMQVELVQERVDRVVMRAEVRPKPSPGEIAILREKILPLLGPDVEFEVEIVPQLAPGPGGKFWVRRSLVNSYYEGGNEVPK